MTGIQLKIAIYRYYYVHLCKIQAQNLSFSLDITRVMVYYAYLIKKGGRPQWKRIA